MDRSPQSEQHRMLAALIAEALHLADELDLDLVGISLDGALDRLTGQGLTRRARVAPQL